MHDKMRPRPGEAAVLCADIEAARAALDAGDNVVLIGADAARLGLAAARLRAVSAGPGRVSVFVGDPSLGEVWTVAAEMAAEQYRSEVRVEGAPRPLPDGGRVA